MLIIIIIVLIKKYNFDPIINMKFVTENRDSSIKFISNIPVDVKIYFYIIFLTMRLTN